MLTDLNWLDKGKPYPPPAEAERIKTYEANEKLFLTKHSDVWKPAYEEISRRLKKRNINVDTVFNYQQLLTKKTADFVCGDPPTIETGDDTDLLSKMLEAQQWGTKLYEAFIDVSRYGNAVPKLVGNRLTAVAPRYWFPIVDPSDLKFVVKNVIAYPVTPDSRGVMTELYAEIHGIGRIETRLYKFDGEKSEIGELKQAGKTQETGLDAFAVLPLTNVTHSGSVYGLDDYAVVNSIVSKIMWRLHCADNILDKHSEPSVSGPSSALELDPKTGMYFLNLGTYFKRNTEQDPDLKYITWDGNLESNFKEIETLLNQLYTLCEMGQAFSEAAGGTADSGEALKLRMVSPRIKAARLVNINSATVKRIIALLAQTNGIDLNYDSLTLRWNDGLPVDDKERTETLSLATGGKAIMSQYAAMKQLGLTDDEVEAELEQMAAERAASMPVFLSPVDGAAGGKDPPKEPAPEDEDGEA